MTAGRREVPRRLVAPGSVQRMFGDRHQFDVGKPKTLHIGNQVFSNLTIVRKAAIVMVPGKIFPCPEMHFIDGQRLVLPVECRAPGHPCRIPPGKVALANDDSGGLRTPFKCPPVWIDLQLWRTATGRTDGKLVQRPRRHLRDKQFPYAALATVVQRVSIGFPVIEVSNHTDSGRRWRPYRK